MILEIGQYLKDLAFVKNLASMYHRKHHAFFTLYSFHYRICLYFLVDDSVMENLSVKAAEVCG